MSHTDINLKPLQDALLDIYKSFSEICTKHHLRYYASGGTALGVKRHGGFILRDDNIWIWRCGCGLSFLKTRMDMSVIATIHVPFLTAMTMRKWAPRFYALLNGGRGN